MIRPNTQPFNYQVASQMVSEGRRLMDHFKAFDGSSADLNPAEGEVQVDVPGRFGINHACAKFAGDQYDGTLEINEDERQIYLDRKYEFKNDDGLVIITQQRPSYVGQRYDVYTIDEIHSRATLEHVTVNTQI